MEHTIQRKLKNIREQCDNKLIQRVIDDALDHGDEAKVYLDNVRRSGCQSGTVSGLVYYCDTHRFFDEYYNEIEDAFYEYSEDVGEQPKIVGDIKNWFAWFGYEWAVGEVLRKMEEYDPSEYDDVDDNN